MGTKSLRLLGKAELLPAETWSLGDHLPASSVTPVPPQSWLRASFPSQRQPAPCPPWNPLVRALGSHSQHRAPHPCLGCWAQKVPERESLGKHLWERVCACSICN